MSVLILFGLVLGLMLIGVPIAVSLGLSSIIFLIALILGIAEGMKDWPPNPGLTDISSTMSSCSSVQ